MDNMPNIAGISIWLIVRHVAIILPAGTLLGAGVALGLPPHPHLDAAARLGTIAGLVALSCIISQSHCFTQSPKSRIEIMVGLRDYILKMAVVTSVIAMRLTAMPRNRQETARIIEEGEHISPKGVERYKSLRNLSTKLSWDLASTASHAGLLSNIGSLDFKFMSGPKSHGSDCSSGKDSDITLSSDMQGEPTRNLNIIEWTTAIGSATLETKGGPFSTQTVLQKDTA
ncbi:hypothetical protein H9Q72_002878 [Fusarium xylarioides]|uniref:Uncharacterized protein n=1 Tax=Fusarium xylarioides TaxID=221167 RepID=A0A9P7I761_9HYPO|nr:hypothetical protein H9Q70_006475 [Fusarium xylarioides]KAG5770133.1 hypothetical protein H9Q72_002878 [Fusarium xylarioides]KAG5783234.1 hypothetical protein H9Q73_003134 [Fusarium xylarioides]KAG5802425.1 hypothetical protein H9Q71_012992 [Fusarium xylarioides]KAG5819303.1 hypothetical protein H9Q74_009542 [Fusarium xylarioides]